MSLGLIYHNLAEAELKEATEYYSLINPRLASAFLDEIEHATHLIIEFPQSNPVIR
jgi:plasmid stabilization system protein ParE